jgi:hypothetical protein
VIEREVAGDGEDGVGNGYVAGSKACFLADDVGVDAGHGGGVAVDEDVARAALKVEDVVVGFDPGRSAVVEKEVRFAEADEGWDSKEREQDDEDTVKKGGVASLLPRPLARGCPGKMGYGFVKL